MSSNQESNVLTVATQNLLLDKTGTAKGKVRPQHERISSAAASLLDLSMPFDLVAVQEAQTGRYRHNGKKLAELVGYQPGYWQEHNQKLTPESKRGRKGEFIGLFGSMVLAAESIDIGDNRRALLTSIANTAFVNIHWRAGASPRGRRTRYTHAERVLEAVSEFDSAVILGDFNEMPIPHLAKGRDLLRENGFESVFSKLEQPRPKTFPTHDYRHLRFGGRIRRSIDDIVVRGDRIRVVGAGLLHQVEKDDDSALPLCSDHEGLWARLEIAPKHD